MTAHPTAEWMIQQCRAMITGETAHRFLVHDRDAIYAPAVDRAVRSMGLRVLKTPVRTPQIVHIVRCPVCWSNGEMIHHDIQASLDYSCRNCSHEWQIDPADEPLEGDPALAEPAQMPSPSTKPPQER